MISSAAPLREHQIAASTDSSPQSTLYLRLSACVVDPSRQSQPPLEIMTQFKTSKSVYSSSRERSHPRGPIHQIWSFLLQQSPIDSIEAVCLNDRVQGSTISTSSITITHWLVVDRISPESSSACTVRGQTTLASSMHHQLVRLRFGRCLKDSRVLSWL